MFRIVTSCLLLLSFALPPSFADVDIPQEHWVKNPPGGYCGYAALETIGRFYNNSRFYEIHHNGKVYGLTSWYSQWESVGMDSINARECLDSLGVQYHLYEKADMEWLKSQIKRKIPILVGCKWRMHLTASGNTRYLWHAILVVDVDDKYVKYIDSNDTTKYHWVKIDWFKWAWPGWAIKVYKE